MSAAAWAIGGAVIGAILAPPGDAALGAAQGALIGVAAHVAATNPAVAKRNLDAIEVQAKAVR